MKFNNYRRTSKKKKKKRIIRKKLTNKRKGGTRMYKHILPIEISELYQDYLKLPFEVCGYISQQTDAHRLQLIIVAKGENKVKGQPASCSTGVNYPVVWHTHPIVTKIYPSLVDIFKVIKYPSITSLIFTQYGFWQLTCPTTYTAPSDEFKDYINTFLDKFYFDGDGKGRQYNLNSINKLVYNINNAMKKGGITNYTISWYDANETNLSSFY